MTNIGLLTWGCTILLACLVVPSSPAQDLRERSNIRHILFVGDSFTPGRYLPVRTYNNTPGGASGTVAVPPHVVDENFGTTVPGRQEPQRPEGEFGPWGGIPGIFAELASQAQLSYDVHIEAISATTLEKNYRLASDVIDQPLWNAVVLQDASFSPIASGLTYNPASSPQAFLRIREDHRAGSHAASPSADVYLYETWAPADTAYLDATANQSLAFSPDKFLLSLAELTLAYRNAYESAALNDGHIRAVAPVGDAWALAWLQGVANPDPYAGSARGVNLSFGYQPGSEPPTIDKPTDAGFHHPSVYGAYLSGLVLFETITDVDVRHFGPAERAAAQLGIPSQIAVDLQRVAWETAARRTRYVADAAAPNACTAQ